ncbi:cupin domain-containing protein [Aliifodinibius sp. S!AR15-10]|uniref:cupin domain-containing protein n=1 Tax=Aliifodinibius sp. S!AR15-10 TaxID=2950437 RepID=UPI002866E4E9|nr:cupin domain-containing protein [Aliifodinibius sp. S!AR15-10]MDR8392604.1 cupin domain-containing protein [Aliifodinibius sp. S!AR15-10]
MDTKLVEQLKNTLDLKPLPEEGGYYTETYRSEDILSQDVLPGKYNSSRVLSTAIFYLLTPDSHSSLHKLPGDEVYHFYLGDPVELLQLHPNGSAELTILGQDFFDGMKLQAVVPGGTWQGARLKDGGTYALLGTTMAPGFDFQDFEAGHAAKLAEIYPQYADLISSLS